MRLLLHSVLVWIIAVLATSSLIAQTVVDAFEGGNTNYREGRYAEAVKEYSSILKQRYGSAEIYFNLGNSYYRLNRMGPAILSYERALRLEPNDPDIVHNLKLANLRIVDRIEAVPELFLLRWLRSVASMFPLSTSMVAVILGWIVLFLSLSALYVSGHGSVVRLARWSLISSLVLVLFFGVILSMQIVQASNRDEAIIMESVVTAKNSPDEESVDAFVIHEGLKVRLSDSVGEWLKVMLADGKVGWVRAQQCERI